MEFSKEPDPLHVKTEPGTYTAKADSPSLDGDICSRAKATLGLQEVETEPDSWLDHVIAVFLLLLTLFSLFPFMLSKHAANVEKECDVQGNKCIDTMQQNLLAP